MEKMDSFMLHQPPKYVRLRTSSEILMPRRTMETFAIKHLANESKPYILCRNYKGAMWRHPWRTLRNIGITRHRKCIFCRYFYHSLAHNEGVFRGIPYPDNVVLSCPVLMRQGISGKTN